MSQIKKILSPVDFSETSEHALRYSIDLASRLGSEVEVLHVYQLPTYALPDGAILARPDFVASLTDELQKQLDELLRRYSGHGVELKGRIVEGMPYAEVNRIAEEEGADMVVMGTHGRTGVKHLLLGSVAERVVRTSKIPVLTVRKPD
jgi:nucleotide-binding universal stress UspA family protein